MVTTAVVENVSANPLFAAICSTAFAYEGWIIATSINSEIQDSKRNLPRALTIGGIIIMITYVAYYIGVSGGATNQQLIDVGPVLAYTNIFGGVLGNILNLFIAISCMGTLNGLILGTSRGIYSLAVRDKGISPKTYSQVDKVTNMPHNSAVLALTIIAAWFVYFYLSNLACTWSGPFVFDCTELPIITIYSMYIPIFIKWIKDQKDENIIRRFILPICAIAGSLFMVYACYLAHGIGCLWYLIVFGIIMLIGHYYY
jgi:APA family basic amino acid/polyamine antiporter